MDTNVALGEIARRVRAWRSEAGLTLQQLASRSQVAASTIHKVEGQNMVPTITVLLKIAQGLGRAAAEFVADERSEEPVAIHRAKDSASRPIPEESSLPRARSLNGTRQPPGLEFLSGDLSGQKIGVWRITETEGAGTRGEELRFDNEVVLLCEHGSLEVIANGEACTLEAGDSIQFRERVRLSWHNASPAPASLLVIGSDSSRLGEAIEDVVGGHPAQTSSTPVAQPLAG